MLSGTVLLFIARYVNVNVHVPLLASLHNKESE